MEILSTTTHVWVKVSSHRAREYLQRVLPKESIPYAKGLSVFNRVVGEFFKCPLALVKQALAIKGVSLAKTATDDQMHPFWVKEEDPWTEIEVKRRLPQVKILYHGRELIANVRGRDLPFAQVQVVDEPALRWEFSWAEVTRSVNAGTALNSGEDLGASLAKGGRP